MFKRILILNLVCNNTDKIYIYNKRIYTPTPKGNLFKKKKSNDR